MSNADGSSAPARRGLGAGEPAADAAQGESDGAPRQGEPRAARDPHALRQLQELQRRLRRRRDQRPFPPGPAGPRRGLGTRSHRPAVHCSDRWEPGARVDPGPYHRRRAAVPAQPLFPPRRVPGAGFPLFREPGGRPRAPQQHHQDRAPDHLEAGSALDGQAGALASDLPTTASVPCKWLVIITTILHNLLHGDPPLNMSGACKVEQRPVTLPRSAISGADIGRAATYRDVDRARERHAERRAGQEPYWRVSQRPRAR
eukprot:3055407-Rhodomonas_salina.6